ncbi:ArsB/NhaD family transporter [Candidatus Kaiserbacteria bacterium]|nr:ArsB/NhaD family transporter [Candidatus Kaiserbacteria bacterium]MCP5303576.1 ArsB/NhaD family transporter [Pseudomonadales bacterium]
MDTVSIVALGIFVITFFFILTERIHRTVIGLFGALAMVLSGIYLDFYHPEDVLEVVDFNTLGLLFGMMLLVGMLEHTGAFQYLGIWTAKKTKGNPWHLLLALSAITATLSMILDNVTMVILIVPITLVITEMLKINPTPIIMAEALLSNVGGAATLVGDPPNIMIGSAAGFSFNDFLVHALPVVVVTWIVTLALFRVIFRKELARKPENVEQLMRMDERDAIKDPKTLKKLLAIFGLVIVLFFTHSFIHLEPAMVALIGAAIALLWIAPQHDPQKAIEKCELSVLLFFASLFVIVGGLEHAGVLERAAHFITSGAENNLVMTALIILWASAVLSAIVDNIPLTVAMIPIIAYLGAEGVPVDILWWALVFGVGFGGNGSPIGSTAGVIVVAKSEKTEHPITFIDWIKQGAPTMILGLVVASGALTLFTHWFETHGHPADVEAAEMTEHPQDDMVTPLRHE